MLVQLAHAQSLDREDVVPFDRDEESPALSISSFWEESPLSRWGGGRNILEGGARTLSRQVAPHCPQGSSWLWEDPPHSLHLHAPSDLLLLDAGWRRSITLLDEEGRAYLLEVSRLIT